jgi:hypothetical protein
MPPRNATITTSRFVIALWRARSEAYGLCLGRSATGFGVSEAEFRFLRRV